MNDTKGTPACLRTQRDALRYTSGELSAEERITFEVHLQHCRECARLVDDERTIRRVFGALPRSSPSATVRALISERAAASGAAYHKLSSPGRIAPLRTALVTRIPVWTWPVAAAAILLLGVSLTFHRDVRTPVFPSDTLSAPVALVPDVPAGDGIQVASVSETTKASTRIRTPRDGASASDNLLDDDVVELADRVETLAMILDEETTQ
ncbi:MAG TPA: zf-HC2 domain-containing protein [Candidatus Latescibacteria bacterium]|nr:zf-HC2 domain-containing protein [Candidatus Latescibacterota bacterium]